MEYIWKEHPLDHRNQKGSWLLGKISSLILIDCYDGFGFDHYFRLSFILCKFSTVCIHYAPLQGMAFKLHNLLPQRRAVGMWSHCVFVREFDENTDGIDDLVGVWSSGVWIMYIKTGGEQQIDNAKPVWIITGRVLVPEHASDRWRIRIGRRMSLNCPQKERKIRPMK